ncbi:hypothetical protein VP01_108g1 [Puccinia sorghi]|uniref:Uncharacterized protein n=1 Tax=Puccinia sorghi TaxID=27349 RepID=A0A0L6VT47_9BASI|nr:hypothetical protein VP01_108g1 [Puccinia sorghi]
MTCAENLSDQASDLEPLSTLRAQNWWLVSYFDVIKPVDMMTLMGLSFILLGSRARAYMDEEECESRLRFTAKGKGRSDGTRTVRAEEGSQATLDFGSEGRSTSDKSRGPSPIFQSSKNRAPSPPSESEDDDHSSPRKKPPPSTRTIPRPNRTQTNKSQPGKRPILTVDPDSESDGDQLAFKGFTRTRS